MMNTTVSPKYTFQAKTGLTIRVRPIQPDDTRHLVDIFRHMGEDSRYRRFHQTVDHISDNRVWQEAERIAQAEPPQGAGLLAFADLPDEADAAVGAARYVDISDGQAEIAISIRDEMQGMGIGTKLLQLTVQEAQAAGICKLVATALNSNEAVWHLLKHLPYPVKRTPDGVYSEIEIDLTSS